MISLQDYIVNEGFALTEGLKPPRFSAKNKELWKHSSKQRLDQLNEVSTKLLDQWMSKEDNQLGKKLFVPCMFDDNGEHLMNMSSDPNKIIVGSSPLWPVSPENTSELTFYKHLVGWMGMMLGKSLSWPVTTTGFYVNKAPDAKQIVDKFNKACMKKYSVSMLYVTVVNICELRTDAYDEWFLNIFYDAIYECTSKSNGEFRYDENENIVIYDEYLSPSEVLDFWKKVYDMANKEADSIKKLL